MSDPAQLPRGAPQALRSFVRCEVDEAVLDVTDAAWLNEIPMISGATTTASAGRTPNRGTITFDAEWTPKFDLEVSIVDGELVASVPGNVGLAANGPIKEWTDALNKTLKDNNKQLHDLRIDGTTLRLRKQPIPVVTDEQSAIMPPPVTAVPTPAEDSTEEPAGRSWGCLTGIVVAVTAILVTVGIVATSGGDDSAAPADSVATETVNTGDPAPAETPAPESTSPPPPTTSTTTTVAQVGEATGVEENSAHVCRGASPTAADYGAIAVPDGNCEPSANPEDDYSSCDPISLPCSFGQTPPFSVFGATGNNHEAGTPDAVTGELGFSTLEEWLIVLRNRELIGGGQNDPANPWISEMTAECDGTPVTGTAEIGPDGTARVDLPLFSFGTCRGRELRVIMDDRTYPFPQVDEYVVDASEREPTAPQPGDYAVGQPLASDMAWVDFTNDVNTINNVIGGSNSVDDSCVFFFEPQNVEALLRVLDGCESNQRFWVFAGAMTNVEFQITVSDTVLGTTATYANPLGQIMPSSIDLMRSTTTDVLFDNSIFPCGYGFVAYTACVEGEPAMEAGGFVTVSSMFGGPVPLTSDGTDRAHHADFSPSGGPRYSATQDGDAWIVTSSAGETRARALIRGNSITFTIPSDELPEAGLTYQWSTEVDGNEHVQPIVPVMGLITTPEMMQIEVEDDSAPVATDVEAPIESLTDFYTQLSDSVSAGDLGFALDRLDPRVLEVYPDSCPAALESFADPELVIEFVSAGPIEDWVYEANEQAVDVPGSQAVTIKLSGRGQSGEEAVAHLSIAGSQYRWFTFC